MDTKCSKVYCVVDAENKPLANACSSLREARLIASELLESGIDYVSITCSYTAVERVCQLYSKNHLVVSQGSKYNQNKRYVPSHLINDVISEFIKSDDSELRIFKSGGYVSL